jgi:hypothetical protein
MKYFATLTITAVSLLAPFVVALAATEAETFGEYVCYGIAFAISTFFLFRMQQILLRMK